MGKRKARQIVREIANREPPMKRVPGFRGDVRCAWCDCADVDDNYTPKHMSDCVYQQAREWCNENGW